MFLLDDDARNHIKFNFLKEELSCTDPEEFYQDLLMSEILFERTHKRKGFKLSVGKFDKYCWLMQCFRNNDNAYNVSIYVNDENINDFISEAKMLDKLYSTERILSYGKRSSQTSTN